MSYDRYLARYNWRVNRLIKLGFPYIRKSFWQLCPHQIDKYAMVQLQSMLDIINSFKG